jgi:hypothetical protein
MPANSDYAPVLDLNAARHRFTERSAGEVVGLLNAGVPVLEMLEASRSRRAVNPLFRGAYAFERIENTRLAWYGRNFLAGPRVPVPEAVPTQLQKDLELVKLRLMECRDPRELDVWLHSAIRVAQALNPYLAPDDLDPIWKRIASGWCFASLHEFQQRWIALFRAVAARDGARMAALGSLLLDTQKELGVDAREYLLMAAMTGYVARGEGRAALELWRKQRDHIRDAASPAFRLLRCHAERSSCVDDFRAYAER